MAEPLIATYSIVACDLEAQQWGVSVQSKFLSVGSVVPWAEPHVGAVATQAYANPRYGPQGLDLLREGLSAHDVVDRLTGADEGRDHRQLGVVDAQGNAATYTGKECMDWAGGRTGEGYAAQGNILVSGATVDALAETFEATAGKPLAVRLIDCLAAAQEAGGDSRGQQSSALLVVERDGGYARMSDVVVELRVEDHELPIEELRRIYTLHDEIFGKTPRRLWLDVDETLATELRKRLATLGYDGELEDSFTRWTGKENLEDRVDGIEQIDAVAGTFIYAQPGTKRGAVATEPNTTVLAIGAKPGVPHEISAWEEIFVAFGHYRNGDEAKAREHLTAFVAANDERWQGHYNLACFEALTKNRNAAIEELRRAIELDPAAKEYAANDTDFDWLRDDPECPA